MISALLNEYTFLLWWTGAAAFISHVVHVTALEPVLGQEKRCVRPLFAVIAFFPIFRLAAFGPVINDTGVYLAGYRMLYASWHTIAAVISRRGSGFGFTVLEILIKMISGGSETAFRVVIAAMHSVPLILILRKYSENYIFSLFLFVAGAYHLSWMMNGMRQFLAAVIIFAASPLLFRKKLLPLFFIILLASLIHTSALIMLPVIFIVQGKAWNQRTMLYLAAAIIAMVIFARNTSAFETVISNTEYSGAITEFRAHGDDGVNPIRVLVNSVPMLLALIGRRQIERIEDPITNVCVNMSVITTGVNLIGMVTSGIMVGRLPVYTSLYNLILLPCLIRRLFNRESARIMTAATVGFYLIYYWFQTH